MTPHVTAWAARARTADRRADRRARRPLPGLARRARVAGAGARAALNRPRGSRLDVAGIVHFRQVACGAVHCAPCSRARGSRPSVSVAAAAALIAGCGSPKQTSTHTTARVGVGVRAGQAQDAYARDADGRNRLARVPAVLREQQAVQRQGLRERGRLRGRRPSSGSRRAQVKWVVEPFDASYAPGPKSFDFDINEISITPARAQAVDFSTPYYTNPQGIIVAANSPYAHAKLLAGLQERQHRRADRDDQPERRSPREIKPTNQPQVFNTSNDVVQAFKIHRVDAIVVDLATAFDLTSTELPHTTIAGQFSAPGRRQLGPAAEQGLAADAVRRQGRQRAAAQTARWRR